MQYKWTALIVTLFGVLTSSFASRIMIIGLPTISAQLHAGAAEVVWVGQAYLLTSTVLFLIIGKISDLYGRVRSYNIGFLLFTVTSLLAAFSTNVTELISFMIIQGVAAAILITNAVTIIADATPTHELGKFLGINLMAFRFGSIIAFTSTGVILTYFHWSALFYPNVIVGTVGTVLGYKKLKELASDDTDKNLDWLGFILFLAGLIIILVAVTYLSYGLTNILKGFAMLSFGIAIITLFVSVERKSANPLLDLKLLKIRMFAGNNIALLLNALTWGGISILFSLYLQIGLGHSPLYAGLALIPLDITYLLSSLIFGNLSDKHGTRLFCVLGLLLTAIGFFLTSLFNGSTSYLEILPTISLVGLGNGMFTSPNISAIMNSVPTSRRGMASGFLNAMFGIGFTISYGLTIHFITFGIKYNTFSIILQTKLPQFGL